MGWYRSGAMWLTFKLLLSSTKHPSAQRTWMFVTMSRGQSKKKTPSPLPSFLPAFWPPKAIVRSLRDGFSLLVQWRPSEDHWHKSTERLKMEREPRVIRKGWSLQRYQKQHGQQQKQIMPHEEDSFSLFVHVIYLSISTIIFPLTYFPGIPTETPLIGLCWQVKTSSGAPKIWPHDSLWKQKANPSWAAFKYQLLCFCSLQTWSFSVVFMTTVHRRYTHKIFIPMKLQNS